MKKQFNLKKGDKRGRQKALDHFREQGNVIPSDGVLGGFVQAIQGPDKSDDDNVNKFKP